jgi:hypothetical protein
MESRYPRTNDIHLKESLWRSARRTSQMKIQRDMMRMNIREIYFLHLLSGR